MGSTKVDELATCPYCGHEDLYVFHYGTDTLYCNKCDKEFAIKLETVIKVKSAKIYDKECLVCKSFLHNEQLIEGKCPKCGYEAFVDNEFKESEFNFVNK